ncbi:ribonuclease T2 [Martensiomyces pterosporus]|nr:ribonuclease T2 [Martensiomyces pterosporus]
MLISTAATTQFGMLSVLAVVSAAAAVGGASLVDPKLVVQQDSGDMELVIGGEQFSPDTCPIDTISCTRKDVDPCCSPQNGLLVLSQQWDTRWGPSDAFTVHGLWPDTCAGRQLPGGGCDRSRAYTNITGILQDSDPDLLADMTTYWPSNKGDNNWFWTHEWVKHGTCVTTLHPRCYGPDSYTPSQEVADYFRSILELREKYDLFRALNASGIVPTKPEGGRRPKNTYTLAQFKAAIRNAWGVDPNVKCIGRRLQEVWLWFKVRGRDNYYPVDPWGSDTCSRISYQRKST